MGTWLNVQQYNRAIKNLLLQTNREKCSWYNGMRKPQNKKPVDRRDVYVCRENQKTTFQNI